MSAAPEPDAALDQQQAGDDRPAEERGDGRERAGAWRAPRSRCGRRAGRRARRPRRPPSRARSPAPPARARRRSERPQRGERDAGRVGERRRCRREPSAGWPPSPGRPRATQRRSARRRPAGRGRGTTRPPPGRSFQSQCSSSWTPGEEAGRRASAAGMPISAPSRTRRRYARPPACVAPSTGWRAYPRVGESVAWDVGLPLSSSVLVAAGCGRTPARPVAVVSDKSTRPRWRATRTSSRAAISSASR